MRKEENEMEKILDFYESNVMNLLSISEQILDEKKADKGTNLKNFKSLLKEEFKFDKMKPLNDILKELEKENLIVIMRGTRIRTSKDGNYYYQERYSEVYSRERIDRIAESKNTIIVTGRRV
jgi:predicted ribosome quality control (RQC) complex YloA/Tae2 family protein